MVKISVVAPLSGDLTAVGTGIKNSVDLAIERVVVIHDKKAYGQGVA